MAELALKVTNSKEKEILSVSEKSEKSVSETFIEKVNDETTKIEDLC